MIWKRIARLGWCLAVGILIAPMVVGGTSRAGGGLGAGVAQAPAAPAAPALPLDPPWQAHLTSGYGSDLASSGVRGAAFVGRTERPVLLPSVVNGMRGDALSGEVQVTGWQTATRGGSPAMTVTLALDNYTNEPPFAVMTASCVIEMPVGGSADVSGTVRYATWDAAARWATLRGQLWRVGGVDCPPLP